MSYSTNPYPQPYTKAPAGTGRYVLTIVSSMLLATGPVVAAFGLVRSNTTISQTRFE